MRFLSLLVALGLIASVDAIAQQTVLSTAWKDGHFSIDTAGLLSRSDIFLGRPNTLPAEAMPMGNGRLGIAVWAADGFTAQLNRVDTLPHRDSPGQLVIRGLATLTSASDFTGRLDLFNGTLIEHGGGMVLTAYVQVSTDTLIVDVTGADPNVTQTAELRLWPPRQPEATASGKTGTLAQSWTDNYGPGATGEKFGSLAAVTATGRDVAATVTNSRSGRPFPCDRRLPSLQRRPDQRAQYRWRIIRLRPSGTRGVVALLLGPRRAHQAHLRGRFRGGQGDPSQPLSLHCRGGEWRQVSRFAGGHRRSFFRGAGSSPLGSCRVLALESAHAGGCQSRCRRG